MLRVRALHVEPLPLMFPCQYPDPIGGPQTALTLHRSERVEGGVSQPREPPCPLSVERKHLSLTQIR